MYEFSHPAIEGMAFEPRAGGPAAARPSAGAETVAQTRRPRRQRIDRIVVINDLSIAKGGGTGLALLSVRLFRELDIPVTYICGDDGENPELDALNADVLALGGEHILNGNRRQAAINGIHNAGAKAMIESWIAVNDTPGTLYHVHGWSKILSPAIFIALSRVARRTVLHAHDFFLACPNGAFYHYPAQKPCACRPLGLSCMASQCDKRSYGQKLWRAGRSARLRSVLLHGGAACGRVLLLHEKMAPAFERSGYPSRTLRTLRNPVTAYREDRVQAEDNTEFFFIGRLEPEKGVEDAVAAAVSAGVMLTVIGDGPLRPYLAGFPANVRVLGWQSHAQIAGHVSRARALLMPTRYPEPFGLVALEASQSGIPVILSDKAYLASEMAAASIAVACDTSDSKAFAAAVGGLAGMPRADLRAMSERAFRTRHLSTSAEEWRDALIGHYFNLIAEA